jgi:hypothetical protein
VSNENQDNKAQDFLKSQPTSDAEKALDAFVGNEPPQKRTVAPPPVVKRPNPNDPVAHSTISDTVGRELSDQEATEVINKLSDAQLLELAVRIEAVRQTNEPKNETEKPRYYTETDFSNVAEKDIYDFSIPIQAIDHNLPDFLKIELKDQNFVARWINMTPRRMGQALAEGWQYIRKEELASKLEIQIQNNVEGHIVYADVVAMKLSKQKVYGRIRGNFLKSLAVTKSSLSIHEAMKNLIKQELQSSPDGVAFDKYSKVGAIGVYSPLAGA